MNVLDSSLAVWYLMRASGVVSLLLLTAVFALGIATSSRWHAGRLPRFVTLALHRNSSLLAVVFLVIHVVTAVVDPYAHVGLLATVVPLTACRNALAIGLGTVSLDLVAALIVSSLLRRHIGQRVWKAVHWLAYASWPVALFHTLAGGTDAGTVWLLGLGALCTGVVVVAVVWRLRGQTGAAKHQEPRPTPVAVPTRSPAAPARVAA